MRLKASLPVLSMVVVLALAAQAVGQTTPAIIFPINPSPQPKPDPTGTATLNADSLYVVQSDLELMCRSYPANLLNITKETGPLRIRARFSDGDGKVETRTFKMKSILIVEAAGTGKATLVVVPVGAKTESEWVERAISANLGPLPPPVPPVPPIPPVPPTPPAPIPVPGLRVLMVYETADLGKLPAGQLGALHSADVRTYLNAKCAKGPDGKTAEWRLWDQNVPTAAESTLWQNAMKRPRTALPWIVISDGTTGYEGPLPNGIAETLALLKKFGG